MDADETEKIVLPVAPGLRDAYVALLKNIYMHEESEFWLHDLIDVVAIDCGISLETAANKCKQLVRLRLLSYGGSSLRGHRYIILVFTKNTKGISPLSNWDLFKRSMETQFSGIVEQDILTIKQIAKTQEVSCLKRKSKAEVTAVMNEYDFASPILPGEDIIKPKLEYLKETKSEALELFEEALRNYKRSKPSSEITILEGN